MAPVLANLWAYEFVLPERSIASLGLQMGPLKPE